VEATAACTKDGSDDVPPVATSEQMSVGRTDATTAMARLMSFKFGSAMRDWLILHSRCDKPFVPPHCPLPDHWLANCEGAVVAGGEVDTIPHRCSIAKNVLARAEGKEIQKTNSRQPIAQRLTARTRNFLPAQGTVS
jgi:hypothetical protein